MVAGEQLRLEGRDDGQHLEAAGGAGLDVEGRHLLLHRPVLALNHGALVDHQVDDQRELGDGRNADGEVLLVAAVEEHREEVAGNDALIGHHGGQGGPVQAAVGGGVPADVQQTEVQLEEATPLGDHLLAGRQVVGGLTTAVQHQGALLGNDLGQLLDQLHLTDADDATGEDGVRLEGEDGCTEKKLQKEVCL